MSEFIPPTPTCQTCHKPIQNVYDDVFCSQPCATFDLGMDWLICAEDVITKERTYFQKPHPSSQVAEHEAEKMRKDQAKNRYLRRRYAVVSVPKPLFPPV